MKDVDQHLVAHDTTTLGVAGVLSLAAVAVTGSPEIAIATAGAVSATGIGAMRYLGPVRRTVNRSAFALAEVKRSLEGKK